MIRLENITKTFPGVKALDRVSFEIHPGEVHALCGENGAGKSTLMKVLSGIWPHASYEGRILRHHGDQEEELEFRDVKDATRAGIAIVHQELALMPEMSVLDNLFMGRELRRGLILRKHGEEDKARAHFDALGFHPPLHVAVKDLSIGQQQRLEIARALLAEPSVLVLDEPTSALPEDDARNLLGWIRKLADSGTACVYISHRMNEVFEIADRVTVLRDGRSIWTKKRAETSPTDVIQAMVDRPPTDMYMHTPHSPGEVLLDLREVKVLRRRRTILSLDHVEVRAGEIVGLAGMMGAGRTCLLRTIVGALDNAKFMGRCNGGRLPRHPAEAMRQGIFLIPEDRKAQALFLDKDLLNNITAATLPRYRTATGMDDSAARDSASAKMKQFAVKANGPETIVRTLSGGNQQKALLCRAADVAPGLLLLDEPTRGIDVGAKNAIYRQMEEWTKSGWGILWSSSELQELLGISDRIYVLANGRISGEFHERPFRENGIMAKAATG